MGRGIVFFVVFLATVVCYAKRQPTPEEIAQERAVQAAMAEIDGAAVKEEAQRRALARAQRLSFAYASGAEAPLFSLLRPMLAIGFELRQECTGDSCLPLTSVRFGGEISLNLWILDIFGRGGGGIAYYQAGVQGLRWHGWGHLGLRHNLIGVIPIEAFVEVASNPYERIWRRSCCDHLPQDSAGRLGCVRPGFPLP